MAVNLVFNTSHGQADWPPPGETRTEDRKMQSQAQKIIQHAKTTGNDIRWSFQDKNFVRVGDVVYRCVRARAFHDACRAAGLKSESIGQGFGWWRI